MSVSLNGPKTPLTKGSIGTAVATLPNVCKMPGPPAPFVPTPLPNIGRTRNSPKGYSKKVKIKGKTIAIKGASFGSKGDIASKGTGGGIVSSNTHGPCKFISPGAMDVKIEGKNVHLLSDMVTNNGGPSGSPANSATVMGTVNEAGVVYVPKDVKCPVCNDEPEPHKDFGESDATKADAQGLLDDYKNAEDKNGDKPYKATMIGVVYCRKPHKYASRTNTDQRFENIAKKKFHIYKGGKSTLDRMKEYVERKGKSRSFEEANQKALLERAVQSLNIKFNPKSEAATHSRNVPGACAAQKALVLALEHDCTPSAMTEKWFSPGRERTKKGEVHLKRKPPEKTAPVRHKKLRGKIATKTFSHGESVPPCETCNLLLPFLTCTKSEEDNCATDTDGCVTCKDNKKGKKKA